MKAKPFMNTIYLASGSPRRREILENLGYQVIRIQAEIDEMPKPQECAADYVHRMACEKNIAAVAQWFDKNAGEPEFPIVTADTAVACNNLILGKPESAEQAAEMLEMLSGKTHQVLTAVCVYRNGKAFAAVQQSDVRFKTLSREEITAYIAGGEPMDKAGAYGIQGAGGVFVEQLQGSFTSVMGLPVFETVELIKRAGSDVPPFA